MKLFDDAATRELPPLPPLLGPLRSFDPPVAAALARSLESVDTKPRTVAAADRAQAQVCEQFRAHHNHSAAFLVVYHGITVAVMQAMDEGRLTPRFFFERL